MAVCIPNMKMPEKCVECPFRVLCRCTASDPHKVSYSVRDAFLTGTRAIDCPLRECPHSVKEDEKNG